MVIENSISIPHFIKYFISSMKALSCDKKLEIAGFLLSFIMAGIAIFQYWDTKQQEFKKLFYEERFRTYEELSETVAKIATLTPHSKERSDAIQQFRLLAVGKARLIGDAEVQYELNKTSKWIYYCVEENAPAPDKELCIDVAGNIHAMGVSAAARNSIINTWKIPLEKLNINDFNFKPHE